MCLMCRPGMKQLERPCMKKYDYMDVLRWEEQSKQRAFERRLKRAPVSNRELLQLAIVFFVAALIAGTLIYGHYA